jgi:hypothetical protein
MAAAAVAPVRELATLALFGNGELAAYRHFELPEPEQGLVLVWAGLHARRRIAAARERFERRFHRADVKRLSTFSSMREMLLM